MDDLARLLCIPVMLAEHAKHGSWFLLLHFLLRFYLSRMTCSSNSDKCLVVHESMALLG
jgi:hypothetical protein